MTHWQMWQQWALTHKEPSIFLKQLQASGEIFRYPEISAMIDVPQDPVWHPEGDVFIHTCYVLDAAAEIAEREGLSDESRSLLLFSALTHDFGKVKATFMKNGRWTSPKHGLYSRNLARSFLEKIGHPGFPGSEYRKIENLVIEHLSYVNVETDKALLNLAERLKPASIQELLWLIEADVSGRPPLPKGLPTIAIKLKVRSQELGVFLEGPCKQPEAPKFKPVLNGQTIIDAGILGPSHKLGVLIRAAKLAQQQGEFQTTEEALAWARQWVASN